MDGIVERPFLVYGVLAVVVVLLPGARARWLGAAGLVAAGVGTAADWVGGSGGGQVFATVNEILLALGVVAVVGAVVITFREKPSPDQVIGVGTAPLPSWGRDPMLLFGLLLAAAGPHLLIVGAGILLCFAAAARMVVREQRYRWLLLLGAAALLVGASLAVLAALLGASGGRVSGVSEGPISPAAERLLVALVGTGGLLASGLWPLHRSPWRLSLAPAGAILLSRLVIPGLPLGLLDWQVLGFLLLLGSIARESLAGRWPGAVVAGGMMAVWSGEPAGVFPGCLLVLTGWLLDNGLMPFAGFRPRWSGIAGLAPALAAPFALSSALRGQVLLAVLAAFAVLLGAILQYRRGSPVGEAPLYSRDDPKLGPESKFP